MLFLKKKILVCGICAVILVVVVVIIIATTIRWAFANSFKWPFFSNLFISQCLFFTMLLCTEFSYCCCCCDHRFSFFFFFILLWSKKWFVCFLLLCLVSLLYSFVMFIELVSFDINEWIWMCHCPPPHYFDWLLSKWEEEQMSMHLFNDYWLFVLLAIDLGRRTQEKDVENWSSKEKKRKKKKTSRKFSSASNDRREFSRFFFSSSLIVFRFIAFHYWIITLPFLSSL